MSELPKGWVEAELGNIGTVYCGQSSTASEVNTAGLGTPYVTGPEQWTGSAIELTKWTERPKRIVPNGCIFITVKGAGVGKLFPGIPCAIGRDVYAYEPSKEIDFGFIGKALKHTIDEVIAEARGDIPGLSKDHIVDHAVSIPPFAEQKRIVGKLDALSAKFARARDHLSRIETLTKRYKQAVLSKAFSGELMKDWRDNALSLKRCRWDVVSLEQLISSGPTNGWSPQASNVPTNLKSLKLSATTGGFLVLNEKTIKYLDAELEGSSKYWLSKNDILIQRANSLEYLGTAAIYDGPSKEFIYPDLMIRVRADENKVISRYLWRFLSSETVRSYFRENATGTAGNMPKINGKTVRNLQVPVPDIDEQKEVVRRIEAAFARIDKLAADAKRALALTDRLDEAILAKAFRGELVPQDPRDEPASALLARIKAERANAPKPKRGRKKG